MKTLALAIICLSTAASAAERYIGGGAQTGVTAPLLFLGSAEAPPVSVSQVLYTQSELGIPTGARIIDVAWRKADLTALPMSGCNVEIWMKNVMLGTTFASGSVQTFGDATAMATRVYSGSGIGLPSTMGFVSFTPATDAISFDYNGADLEVTVVAACQAVAGAVSSSPVLFRYDDVPERVRRFLGDAAPTAASELLAEPSVVTQRPHTRFRFLHPQKTFELRVGDFTLTSGATYGTAAKHLAMNKKALFKFKGRNNSKDPLNVVSLNFSNTANGTPAEETAPIAGAMLMAGEERDITVGVTPAAATTTRFTMSIVTDAINSNFTTAFQGIATPTPEPQPSLAERKPDRTTTNIPATGHVINLGTVGAGSDHLVELQASNFGAADAVPLAIAVTQQPSGGLTSVPANPAPLDAQVDRILQTLVRAPTTSGQFSTQVRVTIGTATYDVTIQGTVAAPELDVFEQGVSLTTPAFISLGAVTVGQMITRTLTLKNSGGNTLYIQRIQQDTATSLSGIYAPPLNLKIQPGASADFTTRFTVSGPSPEILFRIFSDDSNERPFVVRFGTALASGPKLVVTRFATEVPRGAELTRDIDQGANNQDPSLDEDESFVLSNPGDAELVISAISLVGRQNAAPTGEPQPVIKIPAGGAADFKLTMSPVKRESYGLPYAIDVTFESNDPAGPYSFAISGLAKNKGGCGCGSAGPSALFFWVALIVVFGVSRRRQPTPG